MSIHRDPTRRCPLALTGLLLLLATLPLAACGGGGTGGGAAPEPQFFVVSSNPPDGGQAVPVDASIMVTFSEALDRAVVRVDSLTVGVLGTGEIAGQTVVHDDGSGRTLRWTPATGMAPVASHQCVISSALRSVDGARLEGTTRFTFRTAGGLPDVPLPPADALRPTIGRLNVGRRSHTATLLTGGQALVAGGFRQGNSITDTAELYSSEVYILQSNRLQQARASHTATRLDDGRVLLAGGLYEASPGQLATTAQAEVYNPSTGSFVPVGSMATPRHDHAAVLLPDGRVLITGGSELVGNFLTDWDSAEIFDPTTNAFTTLPDTMTTTRSTHVMEATGTEKIILLGGSDVDLRPEYFDIDTESFVALAPAAQDGVRFGAMGASFASGSVCAAGGDALGTVLYIRPSTGLVQNTGSSLDRPRTYGTATQIADDLILVAGGFDSAQGFLSLHTIDLVVEGGIGGSRTFPTEMRFGVGLALHTATRLGDGRVLFCGGLNENGGEPELDVSYVFTP